MSRSVRPRLVAAIVAAGALLLTSCSTTLPAPPAAVGDDFPAGGIPTAVAWPSDWLEGFVGENPAAGGEIVGLRLEYIGDRWVWRIRSADPGREPLDGAVTDPDRGREALVDASTLEALQQQAVQLTEAELARVEVGALAAAQLSGEVYPSPRLVELRRDSVAGRLVWEVTTHDPASGEATAVTLDAATGAVL